MHRSTRALLTAVLAGVPAGTAVCAAHADGLRSALMAHAAKAKTTKVKGPTVNMQWGPVRVTITIKGKKITNVSATAPKERERSAIINEQAIPMLKQEVLQVQSAKIDIISGATMTSDAYTLSLRKAIKKAHFKTPRA